MSFHATHFFQPRTKKEALRLVSVYTLVAIAVAVAITVATNWLTGTPMGLSLIRAVIIPLMLAPWMVWTVARSALRLQDMQTELERLVRTDPLSGALNRRGLAEYADAAFAAHRTTGNLSIVVMDIDDFKSINDSYGHAAGDAVITRIAEITRQIIGPSDCAVGRLGGDELVALMVGPSLEETLMLAERLRYAVEHLTFVHEDISFAVTTSIGVSRVDPRDKSAEAAFRRADKSLYSAKSAGRNRVRAAA